MARDSAPTDIHQMFSLRVGQISTLVSTEEVLEEFCKFGVIGDYYRPTNMDTLEPCPFMFIRYRVKESADNALSHFKGRLFGDKRLTVDDSNLQNSFFTQDTGYITNEMFDTPEPKPVDFDSSLPASHYKALQDRELATRTQTWQIRIDDIPLVVKKEEIFEMCSQFGEISSLYYPINLKNLKPRGFAFVRYVSKTAAARAIEHLNTVCLDFDAGRCLTVTWNHQKEYISQNENPKVVTGLAYNKYADQLPGFR